MYLLFASSKHQFTKKELLFFTCLKKMHQAITYEFYLGETVNLADITRNKQSIDYSNDFKVIKKISESAAKRGVMNADLLRYLPVMLPLGYQGMI